MNSPATFVWPEDQLVEFGNSRVLRGRAVGALLGGEPVIIIAPGNAGLEAALEEFRMSADLAHAAPVTVQVERERRH
jgi:hypothetical protein